MLTTTTLSTSLSAAELNQDYFNGMQLAWVRIPPAATKEEEAAEAQPKPRKKTVPAAKPAPVPATQVPQPAASKPVPPPVSRPLVAPVIKPLPVPATQPAQVPAPKPIPLQPVVKPVPKPAAKPSQPAARKKSAGVEWLVGLGADFGGEELGQLTYSDGSTASVYANKGIAFFFGVILPNGRDSDFSTQLSLGYKLGGPRAINTDVTWSALPLEVIEYYRAGSLRTGLGLSYQLNPQLSVNTPATSYVDKYNNALGFIAQIGWAPVREHFSLDLRYTSIKFQGNGVIGPANADGSVTGIYTSFRF